MAASPVSWRVSAHVRLRILLLFSSSQLLILSPLLMSRTRRPRLMFVPHGATSLRPAYLQACCGCSRAFTFSLKMYIFF